MREASWLALSYSIEAKEDGKSNSQHPSGSTFVKKKKAKAVIQYVHGGEVMANDESSTIRKYSAPELQSGKNLLRPG